MKRLVLLVLVLSMGSAVFGQTVVVAAAANLAALEAPLQKAFAQAHPGMKVQFTFGASGTLVTQIVNGAPFQAFLSADRAFAQKVVDAGLARGPVTYALGKLIFLATKPLDLSRGVEAVLDPAVAQIALANPETAPYGKAAIEALTKAGVYERVKGKLVQGQNIAQALQFTLVAAGFGFVNKSALLSPEVAPYAAEGKFWFEVDPRLYSPIEQGFVVLKSAENLPEVRAWADFLLSSDAQALFAAAGYGR